MSVLTDLSMKNGTSAETQICIGHREFFPEEGERRPLEDFSSGPRGKLHQYCKRCLGKLSMRGRGLDPMTGNTQGTPVESKIPTLAPGEWAIEAVELVTAEPTPSSEEAPRVHSGRIQELLEALRGGDSAYLQIGETLLAPAGNGEWYMMQRGKPGRRAVSGEYLSTAIELVLEVATSEVPLVRYG
jgi:hypothetical protein